LVALLFWNPDRTRRRAIRRLGLAFLRVAERHASSAAIACARQSKEGAIEAVSIPVTPAMAASLETGFCAAMRQR